MTSPPDPILDRLSRLPAAKRRLLLERLRAQGSGERPPAAPVIARRVAPGATAPLSFSQQRLWFLDRFQPGGSLYNMPAAHHLRGGLDRGALARALAALVARHRVLGSTLEVVDGQPVQRTPLHTAAPLALVDLTALPPAHRAAAAAAAAAAEAEAPFDLARGPLLRCRLLALAADEHTLLLTVHHIAGDGWSFGVLLGELGTLYDAALAAPAGSLAGALPELPIQYADYAAWQRDYLTGTVLAEHLDYWRRHLAGAPAALDLPADRPRPPVQRFRGATHAFPLPAAVAAALAALVQETGSTLFMVLLAAFDVLLHQASGQDDLVVGIGIANRARRETEPLVGFFVNTLALRVDLAGNPTFRQLLARVREAAMGAYAHQDLPFEKLVAELRPARDLSRNPLVQVAFVLQNAPRPRLALRGLDTAAVELEVAAAKFDLLLSASEDGGGALAGLFEYNTDLFDPATVAHFAERWVALLAELAADPERRVRMAARPTAELAATLGLAPAAVVAAAPLSPTQRDLFLDHARDPDAVTYSLGVSVRLPRPVVPRLWAQAAAAVVAAEPAARTRFLAHGRELLQVVERWGTAGCEVVELEDGAPGEALRPWIKVPYRLEQRGLLRAFLIRGLAGGDVALFAYHHIAADAVSARLLLLRTAAVYEALECGRPGALDAAAPPPGDFLAAVGDSLARFDTPEVERFWRPRLAGVGALTLGGGDGIGGGEPRPAAARRRIAGTALAALHARAAADGVSLAALLRGLYIVALERLADPEGSVLVYDVVNGRPAGWAATVGCFHQVVPIVVPRGALADDRPLAGFLAEVRAWRRHLGEAQHLSVLLEHRLSAAAAAGDGGLRCFYNFYNFARFDLLGAKATIEVHDSFPAGEVHLIVSDNDDEVEVSLHWNERATPDCGGLLDRLLGLAAQAAAGAARLGELDALQPAERRALTAAAAGAAVAWEAPRTLAGLLAAQARRTPEATAVVAAEGALSYGELARRADRLGGVLQARGVGADSVVAVAVERSLAMVTALCAVLAAGGAYLPLDPDYPPARLRFMLADSGARVLLAGSRDLDLGPPAAAEAQGAAVAEEAQGAAVAEARGAAAADLPAVLRLADLAGEPAPRPHLQAPPAAANGELDLAYVIYTSGSTGLPKGAMNSHGAIANRLLWMQAEYRLTAADRVLQKTPLSFDVSVWEVFWPLVAGACLVVARPEGHKDPRYLVDLIRGESVTTLHFVPSMLRIFLDEPGAGGCDSLRQVMASGEELPRELAERCLRRLPAAGLHNLYGPTEAAVDVTYWACRPEWGGRVPIGRPVANTVIHLLDSRLRPAPEGAPAELWIGGVQLARGYLGRPALTAERFQPDPCAATPGERLYRSGDRARRRPDGAVEYLGRLDNQVKVRGQRIELGEIEAVLGSLPGVAQAAAVVRQDAAGGAVVAYLVAAPAAGDPAAAPPAAAHGELVRHARAHLPAAMVPAHFLWLAALPLLPNGKLDRAALPAPQAERPELGVAFAAAAGRGEAAVTAVWEDVLGRSGLGVLDNFFDLGGHSLLLVEVQARLRQRCGREVPLVELFRHPTPRALGSWLDAPAAAAGAATVPGATDGRAPADRAGAASAGPLGAPAAHLPGAPAAGLPGAVPAHLPGAPAAGLPGAAPAHLPGVAPAHPPGAVPANRLGTVPTGDPVAAAAGEAAAGARPGIAVIGLAGRFPGAATPAELWRRLLDGDELIATYSADELAAAGVAAAELRRPGYVRAKAELTEVECFDAGFFGFSPREAEFLDPQHRVFLEVAWAALEDAGYDPRRTGCPVGVFAGQGFNTYLLANLLTNPERLAAVGLFQSVLGNDKDYLATRVSYKLGLTGPSVNVQTACSTSLVAIHLACRSLADGECDMALAGGISVSVPVKEGYLYEPGAILSPDGHCRAFDAAAQGTVPGNGAAIVVLKRLADAVRDGDTVHAVVLGSAMNNDGAAKVGFTAPSVDGQVEVIGAALARAGASAASIGMVEAHGTGTPLGDPIEVAALKQVYQAAGARPGATALGSVKSNLGHLDAAAGVTGFIKAVLAVEQGEIPPTLHVVRPNPELGLAGSPFYLNTAAVRWPAAAVQGPVAPAAEPPRRAAVSSFGIGGTNAHVILEQAPAAAALAADAAAAVTAGAAAAATADAAAVAPAGAEADASGEAPAVPYLLPLSARSPEALAAAGDRLAAHLAAHPEQALADVAWTLQTGRHRFAHRQVAAAADRAEAAAALAGTAPGRVWRTAEERTGRPVAFLLPGQGAQHAGMGAGLYRAVPGYRQRVDRCAEILAPHLGLDLRQLLDPPPGRRAAADRELERTLYAQPALLTVELAIAGMWIDSGIAPAALLGHSVGELAAAVLAGVLDLEDALWLVARRGQLIDEQPRGAMLAVPLGEDEIAPWLAAGADGNGNGNGASDAEVGLAAVNAPRLCVVSGPEAAVERLAGRLGAAGVACRRLHTSHAFHSPGMAAAMAPFAAEAARVTLRPPRIPLLSGATGTWLTADEACDPWYWARQLRQPVRFAAGLASLAAAEPAAMLLETGPGDTLTSLARRQLAGGAEAALPTLPHPRRGAADAETLAAAIAGLWLAGVDVEWRRIPGGTAEPPRRPRRVPLPTYPFARERHWVDAPAAPAAGIAALAPPAAGIAAPAPAAAAVATDLSSSAVGSPTASTPAATPAAAAAAATRRHPFSPPASDTEELVAAVWEEVLGVAPVGRADDFFELGGHSLLGVQVLSRLRERYPVEVPVDSLFQFPTVAALAERLEELLLARVEGLSEEEAGAWQQPVEELR